MKFLHPRYRLMLALLVGVIAVPITSTALFMQQEILERMDIDPLEIRSKALEDRSRIRAQTRLYWNAIEQFQKKLGQGIDVEKPDVNNPASIERVRNAAPDISEAAESNAVTSLTSDQLDTEDRSLLRRYTRAGFCPESLKDFRIPGFYALCIGLVGEGARKDPVTGFLNDNIYLRQAVRGAAPAMPAFKLRMQMMDQALHGEKRMDGSFPGRPTVCVMNKDCLEPRYSD